MSTKAQAAEQPLAGKQDEVSEEISFSFGHSLKLGSFHIGSSLTDLLTSAIWNRILIVDLGVAAWPVTLLTALRYLLSPFSLWVGHQSDTHPILGSRRTSYIWLGRGLMLLSLPLLTLSVAEIARDTRSVSGWAIAVVSFLIYGIGTLISGAPFLALVHDSAPYARRGQVIAIVQTFLVASFAFGGFLYGKLLPTWNYEKFIQLVLFAAVGAAFFWIVSIWGEERRSRPLAAPERSLPFRKTYRGILSDTRLRRYAAFLGISAFFAFMQDPMLEPFGGDVFGLDVGDTTLFNAYWGVGVLAAMVSTAYITRRWRPEQQVATTAWGLALLAAPLLLLGIVSALELEAAIQLVLIAFGIGFGIFTVGGVALLMAMNREEQAASYLALWSMIQLVSRGLGIFMGGVMRDVALYVTGEFNSAYAILFISEALGLLFCIYLLKQVDIAGFVKQYRGQKTSTGDLIAATTEA